MLSMQPKNDPERPRQIAIDVTGWNQKLLIKSSNKVGRVTSRGTLWRVQPITRVNEMDSEGTLVWRLPFSRRVILLRKTSILRRQCSFP